MSKKKLLEKFPNATIKRTLFKEFDFELTMNNQTYSIKMINVSKNSILTINSKHIWEIKYGRVSGVQFKTRTSSRINLLEFNKTNNRVVIFKSRPYKILKYINESEVIDISDTKEINQTLIFNNIDDLRL